MKTHMFIPVYLTTLLKHKIFYLYLCRQVDIFPSVLWQHRSVIWSRTQNKTLLPLCLRPELQTWISLSPLQDWLRLFLLTGKRQIFSLKGYTTPNIYPMIFLLYLLSWMIWSLLTSTCQFKYAPRPLNQRLDKSKYSKT